MADGTLYVTASVHTDTQEQAARAAEVLSRAATGLALEGLAVSVTIGHIPDDDGDTA